NTQPTILPAHKRWHDLDALRAFAMLLGIGLHGFMSFVALPMPVWPAQDIHQHDSYLFALHAIHGFRLQLFFLVSGFFTMMLFRKRGLRGLVKHRAKRILLPLVVFTLILAPVIVGIGYYSITTDKARADTIWAAAQSGNTEAIGRHLANGTDPDLPDAAGLTALIWAALLGQADAAVVLIDGGADIHATDSDGYTALHFAAFMGEADTARLLIGNGADIHGESDNGDTPLSVTETDEGTTRFLAGLLQVPVEMEKLDAGRTEIATLLKSNGARPRAAVEQEPLAWLYPMLPGLKPVVDQLPGWAQTAAVVLAINWLLSIIPIFQHLWFLYYLILLVGGFAVIAWVARKLNWKPVPAWFITSPLRLLWLVPLTFVPQFFMVTDFGPDTAASPVPWPPLLAYYAVFFGFGALCHGRGVLENVADRAWPAYLLLAVPTLLLGLHWYELRGGLFVTGESNELAHLLHNNLLCALFSVLYAWLMIFGLIGLFRRFFSGGNRRIRYVSDASYWLYIVHMPPIMMLQIWVADWPWPSAVKFLVICSVSTAVLLAVYEVAVRYTWIGTMLNGKKTRPETGGAG
ncbi:MAG: acyltransferase family protein, partial [Verrucomicrobia bacterium]|nr:acyltransferase family protein [Verrucomicrobiota bacterium]